MGPKDILVVYSSRRKYRLPVYVIVPKYLSSLAIQGLVPKMSVRGAEGYLVPR